VTGQERRLVRKWKKANPDEAAGLSKEEILRIITGKSTKSKVKGKEKKRRHDSDDIPNNPMEDREFIVRESREIPDGARCWVCGEEVETDDRATGIIVYIGGDKYYHKHGCGPNNVKWVLGHPDHLALLVYVDANKEVNGGGVERLREFKQMFYPGTIMAWTADQVIHYLRWEKAGFPLAYNIDRRAYVGPKIIEEGTDPADVQDSTIYKEDYVRQSKKHKKEAIMAKKEAEVKETKKGKKMKEEAVEEKKSGKGSGLIPKEAVVVPKELFKHKKIGKLLKEMSSTDDDARKRELRRMLRAEGFKLSDESTWKKFFKELGKGGDDDEEEEEETPKKKKVDKKDTKKGKKKFEEEEEEDEEDEEEDVEDDEEEEEEEEAPKKKGKKGKK
jgi:hypothetical protein